MRDRTVLILFFVLNGCTSHASGGLDTNGAGADAGGARACVYGESDVTNCYGEQTTSPTQIVCEDQPCADVSFDPYALSAGDCYGYTQYFGARDVAESCSQWQAGGDDAGKGDGGCGSETPGQSCNDCCSSSCFACIAKSCSSEWCACSGDAQCWDYVYCMISCENGNANGYSDCWNTCNSEYPEPTLSNGDAVLGCIAKDCSSACRCR